MTHLKTDERWIAKNFGALVDLYGGRYVAVVKGRVVASGNNPQAVERRAQFITRSKTTSVVGLPKRERVHLGARSISVLPLS